MKKPIRNFLFFVIAASVTSFSSLPVFALNQENNGQTLSGIAKETVPACLDKKDYEEIFKLMFVEKDYDAASEMTSFGKCVLIKKNEKLIIKDVGFENIKVRRKGSSKTYWTSKMFVE